MKIGDKESFKIMQEKIINRIESFHYNNKVNKFQEDKEDGNYNKLIETHKLDSIVY